jgi:hypothetical protein
MAADILIFRLCILYPLVHDLSYKFILVSTSFETYDTRYRKGLVKISLWSFLLVSSHQIQHKQEKCKGSTQWRGPLATTLQVRVLGGRGRRLYQLPAEVRNYSFCYLETGSRFWPIQRARDIGQDSQVPGQIASSRA